RRVYPRSGQAVLSKGAGVGAAPSAPTIAVHVGHKEIRNIDGNSPAQNAQRLDKKNATQA
ncbi:TPA: hypothetical protein ACGB9F_003635, partial [Serratia marcescens]